MRFSANSTRVARCTTATHLAAIRSRRPRHWRRSTCLTKSKRWPNCPQRLSDSASIFVGWPSIRTWRRRDSGALSVRLELTPNKASGAPYPFEERRAWRVSRETLARGVWLRPLADVLYVMPPLAISLDELDVMMNTLAVRRLTR